MINFMTHCFGSVVRPKTMAGGVCPGAKQTRSAAWHSFSKSIVSGKTEVVNLWVTTPVV